MTQASVGDDRLDVACEPLAVASVQLGHGVCVELDERHGEPFLASARPTVVLPLPLAVEDHDPFHEANRMSSGVWEPCSTRTARAPSAG